MQNNISAVDRHNCHIRQENPQTTVDPEVSMDSSFWFCPARQERKLSALMLLLPLSGEPRKRFLFIFTPHWSFVVLRRCLCRFKEQLHQASARPAPSSLLPVLLSPLSPSIDFPINISIPFYSPLSCLLHGVLTGILHFDQININA